MDPSTAHNILNSNNEIHQYWLQEADTNFENKYLEALKAYLPEPSKTNSISISSTNDVYQINIPPLTVEDMISEGFLEQEKVEPFICLEKYNKVAQESDEVMFNKESGRKSWISEENRVRKQQRSTKGLTWTPEEHRLIYSHFSMLLPSDSKRLFLIGMDVHGRGDWRNIAKNFVRTRTTTQVASHAQKFFNRQIHLRQKRRHSIHDVTTLAPLLASKPSNNLSVYDRVNIKFYELQKKK